MHILALPVIIAGNSLIYADNHSEDNIIERIQIESKGNVIIDIRRFILLGSWFNAEMSRCRHTTGRSLSCRSCCCHCRRVWSR